MDQFLLDRQEDYEDDAEPALSKDTKLQSNSDIVGALRQSSFGSSASKILQRQTTQNSGNAMRSWVNRQATSSHRTSLRIRSIYSRKQSLKSNGLDRVSEKKIPYVNFFQELMQYNDGSGAPFDMYQAERDNSSGRHQTVLSRKMQLSTYDNDADMRLRSDTGSSNTIVNRIVEADDNSFQHLAQ